MIHPTEETAVSRLLRQHESLREVIESISGELELGPLLTLIVRNACELLDAGSGTIGLFDEGENLIRLAAVHNIENPPPEIIPPGVGLSGLVFNARQTVVLDRYDAVPAMTVPALADHTAVGMPILWGGQLIGIFCVLAPPPRRFGPEDAEILALYARHAAIAIRNARTYKQETGRSDRIRLLARIGRTLASDLELDTLCDRAVQIIHELLGYPNVALGLIEPGEPEIIVVRHLGGGYRSRISGEHRFHIRNGLMGAAVRLRCSQSTEDAMRDPRYFPAPGAPDVRGELAVPIIHGEKVLGVLNLESPGLFTEEDAASLQIIADHLAVAISNARLFADTRQIAVLEERQRLARDLHDSITQMVFSASLMAQSLNNAWRRDPAEGERITNRVVDTTRAALVELRAVLQELRPEGTPVPVPEGHALPAMARLRRDGLPALIRHETQRVVGDEPALLFDLDRYLAQPFETEEVLYRVFQEALSNALKHARATWVRIELFRADGRVVLRVTDDGVGFDPAADPGAGATGGLGRFTMRERMDGLSGTLSTDSRPGRGTVVEAILPCRGVAA